MKHENLPPELVIRFAGFLHKKNFSIGMEKFPERLDPDPGYHPSFSNEAILEHYQTGWARGDTPAEHLAEIFRKHPDYKLITPEPRPDRYTRMKWRPVEYQEAKVASLLAEFDEHVERINVMLETLSPVPPADQFEEYARFRLGQIARDRDDYEIIQHHAYEIADKEQRRVRIDLPPGSFRLAVFAGLPAVVRAVRTVATYEIVVETGPGPSRFPYRPMPDTERRGIEREGTLYMAVAGLAGKGEIIESLFVSDKDFVPHVSWRNALYFLTQSATEEGYDILCDEYDAAAWAFRGPNPEVAKQ